MFPVFQPLKKTKRLISHWKDDRNKKTQSIKSRYCRYVITQRFRDYAVDSGLMCLRDFAELFCKKRHPEGFPSSYLCAVKSAACALACIGKWNLCLRTFWEMLRMPEDKCKCFPDMKEGALTFLWPVACWQEIDLRKGRIRENTQNIWKSDWGRVYVCVCVWI